MIASGAIEERQPSEYYVEPSREGQAPGSGSDPGR